MDKRRFLKSLFGIIPAVLIAKELPALPEKEIHIDETKHDDPRMFSSGFVSIIDCDYDAYGRTNRVYITRPDVHVKKSKKKKHKKNKKR